MPSPALHSQSSQNRSTAGQWSAFSSHRQQLERLLVPPEPGRLSLCVLGAGNCNDLDLPFLSRGYREVHLVDIDADALAKALERQRVSAPGIHIHAPIDLSGLCDLPEAWQRLPQPPAAIERQILVADNRPRLDLGPFDVVLSPCVLSQLLYPIRNALGVGHPQLKRLCTAIRHRHLRMILELLKPGGKAILALDLADNDAFPGLPRVGQDQLTDLMKSLLRDRRYFPGLEPACLRPALDNLPARNLAFTSPWLWHLSIRRSFLVYAAIFHHA